MTTLTPKYQKILTGLIDDRWRELNRQADSMNTSRREVKQLVKKMNDLEKIAGCLGSLKLKDRRLLREALANLYKKHEGADLLRMNTKEMTQRTQKMREITKLANILN